MWRRLVPRCAVLIWTGALLETNPPTPFSSDNDPTELSEIDETEPAGKPREGLPSSFRMRNAHYVDQLETPPRPTLKSLAIASIDSEALRDLPESLVASIRKHGVLEPLVVQQTPRGKHYRLIAGRLRLAAARAAGLKEVPCVVHTVSDAEAADLIEAIRLGADRAEPAVAPAPAPAPVALYPAQRELESALTTIESCTPLLTQTSLTARRGAVQVIAAECRRSQRLLKAMTILTDSAAMHRALLTPGELFDRLSDVFRDEQRLLGTEPAIHVYTEPQLAFYGDDQLLLTAMSSALSALTAVAGSRPRDVAFSAASNAVGGTVSLDLTDRSVVVSDSFVRTAFTTPWPVPDGDTVLLLLQAARRIASAHNGSLTITSDPTRTTIRLQLPADQVARGPVDRAAN